MLNWGIPHNWDMSFGKFGGLPTLEAFPEKWFARQEQIVLSMSANEFTELPTPLDVKFHKA